LVRPVLIKPKHLPPLLKTNPEITIENTSKEMRTSLKTAGPRPSKLAREDPRPPLSSPRPFPPPETTRDSTPREESPLLSDKDNQLDSDKDNPPHSDKDRPPHSDKDNLLDSDKEKSPPPPTSPPTELDPAVVNREPLLTEEPKEDNPPSSTTRPESLPKMSMREKWFLKPREKRD